MEYARVEAIDGKRPMILKAMPKTSIMVKLRRNSCLYPSLADTLVRHTFSSADELPLTQVCCIVLAGKVVVGC